MSETYGPWLDDDQGRLIRQHGETGRTYMADAAYVNRLEAKAALADERRGSIRKPAPYSVEADWAARYDALTKPIGAEVQA